MSNTLDVNSFGDRIYNKFPAKYRLDDKEQDFALKRFIQTAGEGFSVIIEDTNSLLELVDIDKIPTDKLPIIFKQYGLNIFNGIPETYLRNLLPNLSTAWAKKGSKDVLEYIATSLASGAKVRVSAETITKKDDEDITTAVCLTIRVYVQTSFSGMYPNAEQYKRILGQFIPFYCDFIVPYVYEYDEVAKVFGEEVIIGDELKKVTREDDAPLLVEEDCDTSINEDRKDTGSILINDADETLGLFLNSDFSVLNGCHLNIPQSYDIVTKDSKSYVIYNTHFGTVVDN